MNRCLAPRQQELVDIAGKLADTFAERATEHDRDNTFPELPYELMWRDAQAGMFMPMGNLHARKIIGASALGVEIAPVIGFDETGPDSRAKS